MPLSAVTVPFPSEAVPPVFPPVDEEPLEEPLVFPVDELFEEPPVEELPLSLLAPATAGLSLFPHPLQLQQHVHSHLILPSLFINAFIASISLDVALFQESVVACASKVITPSSFSLSFAKISSILAFALSAQRTR